MSGPSHISAEAGNNHNGDANTARHLIDLAVAAGADSVKFQLIHPESLYLPAFPRDGTYEENPMIAARKRHTLSDDDYRGLADYSREKGIGFSASVFDRRGLDLLEELDVDYIKIASCDLDNIAFVRTVAERGRRVVLSTGMATLDEIERTADAIAKTGNADVVLLHCVSVYPVRLEQMNLSFLDELKRFGYPVGLSDHTRTSHATVIGLALGATWFEKHFTLDREQEGFDHAYALEPGELSEYIGDLRSAELAMAPATDKVGPKERMVAERARRAIYAARDLTAGEVLTPEDVLVVRPRGPLAAAELERVVGRRLSASLRRYEALSWEVLGG